MKRKNDLTAPAAVEIVPELPREEVLLKAGALQNAIFNSANFSSIATDEKGVIQIFNVGAERMLGYSAAEVLNKITPAEISDPRELVRRAESLSQELETTIAPGFEALVFKASRGIEDVYELTYIRKDGSRFPAVVSVTALRDGQGGIIGYLLIGTDNTARKQAEEALLKAGALQKAIFNSANFSCIATDAKGVIQIFNVGAERMLGYTNAEVVNRITAADLHDLQEVIERATDLSLEFGTPIAPGFEALVFKAARGIEDIYEVTKVRKDGSRFPAVVSVTALRDAQGRIIGYLLIGTDNTARQQVEEERKRAEEARRISEARYRTLFEYAPDGIVIADADGIYLEANGSICEMLGYQREEMIGMPSSSIVAVMEVEPNAPALGLIKAESPYDREWQCRRKDGSSFDAEVIATKMPDGNVLAIIRDISERKNAELALRDSEERFRTMADSISQLAWVARADGHIYWYNQRWFEYTGTTLLQMEGWGWQSVHDPKILPKVMEKWQAVITDEEPFEMEFPLRGADGQFRTFLTRVAPVRDSAGKLVNWFGTNTDITVHKHLEEALKASLADRELLLREIHHRVKNNMQLVCSLLQLQAKQLRNPEMSAVLSESQTRVRSMALIHEKLYGGDSLARIDLADYLRSLGAMIQRSQPERARVSVRFALVPLTAGMDTAVPLGLAVNELLTNAFKHAFPAGPRFAIPSPEIVIALQPEADGRLRLEVRDNGVGLPADFGPERGGSLGMRLVQIFAKQLHCELTWSSGSGGSVFEMCFQELKPKRPQPIAIEFQSN